LDLYQRIDGAIKSDVAIERVATEHPRYRRGVSIDGAGSGDLGRIPHLPRLHDSFDYISGHRNVGVAQLQARADFLPVSS